MRNKTDRFIPIWRDPVIINIMRNREIKKITPSQSKSD